MRIVIILLALLLALAVTGWTIMYFMVDQNIHHGSELEVSDLGVNEELPEEDVINIALFGLDERGETDELYDEAGKAKSFHSDAIIILTIDSRDPDNPRIKMSSLARDTLVYVEGYNSKNSR